jgi:ribosomal protein S27AE
MTMETDWPGIIFFSSIALILGAVFLGYVRAGMVEAEAAWRMKMRNRFCVRCGYSLRGNVSGVCPECGRRFKADAI